MKKIKQLSAKDKLRLLSSRSKYNNFTRTKRDKNTNSSKNIILKREK